MNTKTIARGVLLAAVIAAPALAVAQDYRSDEGRGYDGSRDYYYSHGHRYHRHYRTCGADRRRRANNGTAIGAVSGGVLGSALGGGHVGNILLGAGAGAVAGHEIGRNTTRC